MPKQAKKLKRNINVLLRLTSGNQFGMNEDEVEDMKEIVNDLNKDDKGRS